MQMEEAEYPLSPCGDWAYRRSYNKMFYQRFRQVHGSRSIEAGWQQEQRAIVKGAAEHKADLMAGQFKAKRILIIHFMKWIFRWIVMLSTFLVFYLCKGRTQPLAIYSLTNRLGTGKYV